MPYFFTCEHTVTRNRFYTDDNCVVKNKKDLGIKLGIQFFNGFQRV